MEGKSDSIFSHKNSRLPDDTVFYSIYPDFSIPSSSSSSSSTTTITSQLQSLHLQILSHLSPFTSTYIYQHSPFTLSLSPSPIPHLHGNLRYGDNLDDEWFVVFLLLQTSLSFPNLSISVHDSDGEFLLIESAYHLPRWLNPETSPNRLFLRGGKLHLIPKSLSPSPPSLTQALTLLTTSSHQTLASAPIQDSIQNRIKNYYPGNENNMNMHRVRVRVPVSVAEVLKHEPCLISLAVEGFYDRDIDSMKYAAKMERFLGDGEEVVEVCVRMSRAMYAQLMQQTFQAPKGYPMPARSDVGVYKEAELGMKIACGFEMMYQVRKRDGVEGKGSSWVAFRESLERSGYFEGLLPGSKEYKRLMENAQEYYKSSSVYSRASEMMSAPVRRIDEILALPISADDFRSQELPPSDDDSWLYNGEDELNAAIIERQKEMELYNSQHKGKQKLKEQQEQDPSPSTEHLDDFGLGDIAKSMQSFVQKMSSYKGAEVPENRNLEDVDFDVDRFMKDMESVMGHQGSEATLNDEDIKEGSSSDSDMDFDDSDYGSDIEPSENNEGGDSFMGAYSSALNEELKTSTLNKSFVRASQSFKTNEGTSNTTDSMDVQAKSNAEVDMDEEFTPVDVDVNLVKSFLDSFSSQQGLPGPATNLLGLMGLRLPQDPSKDK